MAGSKAKAGAKPDPNAWMVTFGDLITLMLTFFVLLLTMSSMDVQKAAEIARSASGTVLAPIDDVSLGKKTLIMDELDLLKEVKSLLSQKMVSAERDLVSDAEYKARLRDEAGKGESGQAGFVPDVEERGLGTGEGEGVALTAVKGGVKIELPEAVTFRPGSAELTPSAENFIRGVFEGLGEAVRRYRLDGIVAGHTDDRAVHSPLYPSNWELSCARASILVEKMIEFGGVNPGHMSAAGYGPEKPVADNATPEGRARNRRVDILLRVTKESDLKDHSEVGIDYEALQPAASDEIIDVDKPENPMGPDNGKAEKAGP